jgi:hypothetical protein
VPYSFAPTAPDRADNWIQTVPGKGWLVVFRFYGPLEAFTDHTWKPADIEFIA